MMDPVLSTTWLALPSGAVVDTNGAPIFIEMIAGAELHRRSPARLQPIAGTEPLPLRPDGPTGPAAVQR